MKKLQLCKNVNKQLILVISKQIAEHDNVNEYYSCQFQPKQIADKSKQTADKYNQLLLASLAMFKIGDIFEFLAIVNCNFIFQMLVVFKSAPILKRTLKVKHAMMQLYVLKLLKMQTKYLGRQWRKSNMKTMSAIYTKVRHRLNDDWAYGNGKKFFHIVEK